MGLSRRSTNKSIVMPDRHPVPVWVDLAMVIGSSEVRFFNWDDAGLRRLRGETPSPVIPPRIVGRPGAILSLSVFMV